MSIELPGDCTCARSAVKALTPIVAAHGLGEPAHERIHCGTLVDRWTVTATRVVSEFCLLIVSAPLVSVCSSSVFAHHQLQDIL